jgi:hypothetical protein
VVVKELDDVHFDIMRKTLAHEDAASAAPPGSDRRDGG